MARKTTTAPGDNPGQDDSGQAHDPGASGAQDAASRIRESAQQIWLAGLGAFAKAQAEGGRVFETLVKEGGEIQRKTQAAAEEHLEQASQRMAGMATGFSSRASGEWDRLGALFEDRVARALHRLGIPDAQDIADLQARIAELEREVAGLRRQGARKSAGRRAGDTGETDAAPRRRRDTSDEPDKP